MTDDAVAKRPSIQPGPIDKSLEEPVLYIRPTRGWRFLNLRELWDYRELLYFLVWRGVKVRYKQTLVGVAWAVLQPLAMMVVFAVFFGLLARVPSDGIPYPLFAFGGLVPWQFFARVFGEASSSLIAEQRLITRVYFPRVIIPLATTLVASVELFISGCLLIVIMLFYGVVPGPTLVTLPIFLVLLYVTAVGVGLLFAALNVEYRDVMYLVPFFVQVLFFLTPIVYPSRMVPEVFRVIYGLNPMVGVVEGFRWAFFGIGQGFKPMLISSGVIGILLLVVGIFLFARMERTFADNIGS